MLKITLPRRTRVNVHDTFELNLGIFMYKHHSNQLPPVVIVVVVVFKLILCNCSNTQQGMVKTTVSIKQRKCFLILQLEIFDLFMELFWQIRKTLQNYQTLPKSVVLCHYGACIFVCFQICFICKSLYICLFQAFMTFWSCPQYHGVFIYIVVFC